MANLVRRTKASTLTEREILALKPGQKRSDGAMSVGSGRLVVRAVERSNGSKRITIREFYFRYFADGKERTMRIGEHGVMSTPEARQKAKTLADQVAQGLDPQEQRGLDELSAQQQQRVAVESARRERSKGTLEDLIDSYVEYLRAAEKVSAADVERTLKRHVILPFPALAATRASEISADDITNILARMIANKIERRTNIVRALLRAAFAYGAGLDNDPERRALALKAGEQEAKRFGIGGNPVADVKRIGKFDKALDRVLTDDEIRDYWSSLESLHPAVRGALRAALLLGGQRLSQLKRLSWKDYNATTKTLSLRDTKGRGEARDHVLPVSTKVEAILDEMRGLSPEGFIFSTRVGNVEIDLATLSSAVTEIARRHAKGDKSKAYSAADIRRTVETRLAARGVSKEVRAHVLSHGRRSDVQGRHYDKHDYLPEKRAALVKWEALLELIVAGKTIKQKRLPLAMAA